MQSHQSECSRSSLFFKPVASLNTQSNTHAQTSTTHNNLQHRRRWCDRLSLLLLLAARQLSTFCLSLCFHFPFFFTPEALSLPVISTRLKRRVYSGTTTTASPPASSVYRRTMAAARGIDNFVLQSNSYEVGAGSERVAHAGPGPINKLFEHFPRIFLNVSKQVLRI